MNAAQLLSDFRSEMADLVEPYLWTDEDVIRYTDSAQKMFCRLVGGVADATSAVTQLSIVPNTEWYAISPKILKIRKAVRTDTGRSVDVLTPEMSEGQGLRFNGMKAPFRCLVQGTEDSKLRAYPVPTDAVTVNLQILRMPLRDVTSDVDELEIPEAHHEYLLLWMRSLAYMKQDAETIDKNKSADYEAQFRAYCKQVERELSRQRRNAGSVAYGGI